MEAIEGFVEATEAFVEATSGFVEATTSFAEATDPFTRVLQEDLTIVGAAPRRRGSGGGGAGLLAARVAARAKLRSDATSSRHPRSHRLVPRSRARSDSGSDQSARIGRARAHPRLSSLFHGSHLEGPEVSRGERGGRRDEASALPRRVSAARRRSRSAHAHAHGDGDEDERRRTTDPSWARNILCRGRSASGSVGVPMPPPKSEETIAPSILDALRKLVERWTGVKARERANYQLYLGELCAALDVEGPRPAGSGYEYEFPIKVVDREGKEGSNFVDLFKRDHFVLEAKDKEPGRTDELMLRKAYGQARSYVTHLPGTTPPYLLILDVAKTMMVWDRWEGGFGGFGAGRRIDLPTLHERASDIALLRDIWRRLDAFGSSSAVLPSSSFVRREGQRLGVLEEVAVEAEQLAGSKALAVIHGAP